MNAIIAIYMWVMVAVVACACEGTRQDEVLYYMMRRMARTMLVVVIVFTGALIGRAVVQWLK